MTPRGKSDHNLGYFRAKLWGAASMGLWGWGEKLKFRTKTITTKPPKQRRNTTHTTNNINIADMCCLHLLLLLLLLLLQLPLPSATPTTRRRTRTRNTRTIPPPLDTFSVPRGPQELKVVGIKGSQKLGQRKLQLRNAAIKCKTTLTNSNNHYNLDATTTANIAWLLECNDANQAKI